MLNREGNPRYEPQVAQMSIAPESGFIPEWTTGDRMRKARELASLKQSEMAAEIGIGRSTIVTYETGKSEPPRPVLLAWSFRTGVPLQWLHSGTVPPVRGGDEASSDQGEFRNCHVPRLRLAVAA
jgi:DNA-binding XRE family transcriptional regulator